MSTAVGEARQQHPVVVFKRDVEVMSAELDMLDDKARARMRNAAVVAVTKDPELLHADRASLMMALRMCAQHGVVPDGNEATLQVYSTKVKQNGKEVWIKKVQYQPMIRGIINRVLRSGKVLSFWAEVVHEDEQFSIDMTHGDRRPLHYFDPLKRQGPIVGAYSVAKWANGAIDCEVMTAADIQRVRGVAKTQAVWDAWFEEKSKVAVMRRHSKRLALAAEDMDFIMNPDEHDFDQAEPAEPVLSPLQMKAQRARQQAQPIQPEPDDPPSYPHWTEDVDLDGAIEGSEAWVEGEEAAKAEQDRQDCPYDGDELLAADWLAGFDGMRRAME